jgi:hypothetical protein
MEALGMLYRFVVCVSVAIDLFAGALAWRDARWCQAKVL